MTVAATIDPDIARRKRMMFAAQALAVAGMGMGRGDDEAYQELEGPLGVDGPELHRASGYWWSCATTVMGIMRLVGVLNALLWARYVIGKAMSWDVQIGMDAGVWRTWGSKGDDGSDALPDEGDFVIVGPGGFHILTLADVVRWPSSSPGSPIQMSDPVTTVEGGQNDGRGMCILKLSRRLFVSGGALYCGNSVSPSTRVYGWIDCTRLPTAAVV